MSEVKLRNHPHAELMIQWLLNPELEIEFKAYPFSNKWVTILSPSWEPNHVYRIKPKPQTYLYGIKVPAPVTKILPDKLYYVVSHHNISELWSTSDIRLLEAYLIKGIVFENESDARAYSKVLYSPDRHTIKDK